MEAWGCLRDAVGTLLFSSKMGPHCCCSLKGAPYEMEGMLGMVALACNPRYLEGGDGEVRGLRPAQGKSEIDHISTNKPGVEEQACHPGCREAWVVGGGLRQKGLGDGSSKRPST